MGGGFFHRNEKFQKTKVIYFMLGTSSLMGGSKIRILHFIIIPYPCKESEIPENDTSHFRVAYNLYSG